MVVGGLCAGVTDDLRIHLLHGLKSESNRNAMPDYLQQMLGYRLNAPNLDTSYASDSRRMSIQANSRDTVAVVMDDPKRPVSELNA